MTVKLSQPLSFRSDCGQSGYITELAPTFLVFSGHLEENREYTIKLQLTPEQIYSFSGTSSQADSDSSRLELGEQSSLESMSDLLGQLRKDQHIEICNNLDVESSDKFTGFSLVNFIPEAWPNLDFDSVDTNVEFLSRTFSHPMLITGMTGGVNKGEKINRNLALMAQRYNIPMGVGSQRIAIENPKYNDIFNVKKFAKDIFLIGNIGFAQLRKKNALEICQKAVDMIDADALAIHINVIQEAVQEEGDREFSGSLEQLSHICQNLSRPVIVKEVGCGISQKTAQALIDAGVSAIDVGGRGGTSWGYIEGLRSTSETTKNLADSFRNWGIPTAYSLAALNEMKADFPVTATGGIRDGLMVAKAVALGARFAGIGLPLLRAAMQSEDAVMTLMDEYVRGLKTTMVATGSAKLDDLAKALTFGQPYENKLQQLVSRKSQL